MKYNYCGWRRPVRAFFDQQSGGVRRVPPRRGRLTERPSFSLRWFRIHQTLFFKLLPQSMFPTELESHIFTYCSLRTLRICSTVCKRWSILCTKQARRFAIALWKKQLLLLNKRGPTVSPAPSFWENIYYYVKTSPKYIFRLQDSSIHTAWLWDNLLTNKAGSQTVRARTGFGDILDRVFIQGTNISSVTIVVYPNGTQVRRFYLNRHTVLLNLGEFPLHLPCRMDQTFEILVQASHVDKIQVRLGMLKAADLYSVIRRQ